MDRFFDRLGDVIKNFLDDEDDRLFGTRRSRSSFRDPDLEAAEAELDDFLNERKERGTGSASRQNRAWADPEERATAGKPAAPEVLRRDFAELGVPFGASGEDCKAAYKKLLKIHHPDRHAGHEGNLRKATEKSSRINASYQRIERWRETGKID